MYFTKGCWVRLFTYYDIFSGIFPPGLLIHVILQKKIILNISMSKRLPYRTVFLLWPIPINHAFPGRSKEMAKRYVDMYEFSLKQKKTVLRLIGYAPPYPDSPFILFKYKSNFYDKNFIQNYFHITYQLIFHYLISL